MLSSRENCTTSFFPGGKDFFLRLALGRRLRRKQELQKKPTLNFSLAVSPLGKLLLLLRASFPLSLFWHFHLKQLQSPLPLSPPPSTLLLLLLLSAERDRRNFLPPSLSLLPTLRNAGGGIERHPHVRRGEKQLPFPLLLLNNL